MSVPDRDGNHLERTKRFNVVHVRLVALTFSSCRIPDESDEDRLFNGAENERGSGDNRGTPLVCTQWRVYGEPFALHLQTFFNAFV